MRNLARLGLVAAALAPGCDWGPQYCDGDWAAAQPSDEPATSQRQVVAQVLPAPSTGVDMLFVIDDSLSMKDEQEQLGIWSNEMFDVLSSSGQLPDLHIAVTTSSVPIAGLEQCKVGGMLAVGSASLQNGDRYLKDISGLEGRVRNYSGTLTETFAKMARVGDGGCGLEQPFEAARRVLSGVDPGAKGFLRDNALLLVVFVTDEDDCSATDPTLFTDAYADACSDLGPLTSYRCFEHGVVCYDGKGSRAFGDRHHCRADESGRYEQTVSGFADYLKKLKSNPAQVVVAGIYGKPNGITAVPDEKITTYQTPRLGNVCGTGGLEGTGATPAVRLNALMAEFGGRASQSSICESQLSWAMHDVGLITRGAATQSRCLHGQLLDVDAANAGLQPACRVDVARDVGTKLEKHLDIPPCDRSGPGERCFSIANENACGETESQMAVRVDALASNETMTVSCDVDLADGGYHPADGEERGL